MVHQIVVIGSINADLIVNVARQPAPGETVLGRESVTLPGGKGANQAVAAARLGGSVAFVGAVGLDAHADLALSGLRDAGVDLAHVRQVDRPTGLAVITVSDDSANSIVVIPGANDAVMPEAVDAAESQLAGARVCVLQAEIPLATVIHAANVAHDLGVRVLLNVAPAAALPLGTICQADPLVVNEHEAAVLLGHPVEQPLDAATELAGLGVASVIITLGAAGVAGCDHGRTWSLAAVAVEARDSTGAGDAFVGTLAAELAKGSELEDAARHATRVAAASVTRLGAQTSYPWKGEPLP